MTELKTFTELVEVGHRPAPGACAACATQHPPEQPHNMTLFYKYAFHQQHDRWPTWNDAMSHCAPAIQRQWREGLREIGIDVPEPEVTA